jgi:hypothetical protein
MKQLAKKIESLPDPLMRALTNSKYDAGETDFSVTTLISPPQRTYLATIGEKIENVYSSFHALLGSGVHAIIEGNVNEEAGEIAEKRYFMQRQGYSISGQVDYYKDGVITDWKITGGIQEDMKPEHFQQVQMNGYLAEENGLKVELVSVVYYQRDWRYMISKFQPDYPKNPVTVFVAPYDRALAESLFEEKIKEHSNAFSGNPRNCTEDEKWQSPPTFAVMKPGASRASKVFSNLNDAEEYKKDGQIIETRKSERVYCSNFCGFSHLCKQYEKESKTLINDF